MMVNIVFIDEVIVHANIIFNTMVREIRFTKKSNFNKDDVNIDSHSTICIRLFEERCKQLRKFSITNLAIKNPGENGNVNALKKALRWCRNNDVDLLNISVGTIDINDGRIIEKEINKLINRGIVICASISNCDKYTFPGSLKNVIGVRHNIRYIQGGTKLKTKPYIGVDIELCSPMKITSINGSDLQLNPSNSYATPVVSAIIANYMSDGISITCQNYCNYLNCSIT